MDARDATTNKAPFYFVPLGTTTCVRARGTGFSKIENSIVFEFRKRYWSISNAPTVQATKAHGGPRNVSHMHALDDLVPSSLLAC